MKPVSNTTNPNPMALHNISKEDKIKKYATSIKEHS
jgi:hypothetical protein